MPYSTLSMQVRESAITCELPLPLKQLQLAVPFDVTRNPGQLLASRKPLVDHYLKAHFRIVSAHGGWRLQVQGWTLDRTWQPDTGNYDELTGVIRCVPPYPEDLRDFEIRYDGIMHQVVTHKTLVEVREDWQNGRLGQSGMELGNIYFDASSQKVHPFEVHLENGSAWTGFRSMVALGMDHIAEGTDHLLFLILLLVVAPLTVRQGRWEFAGSFRFALLRLLKIITAFTIGHSVTLVLGTLDWLPFLAQWIEVLSPFPS